MDPKKNAWPGRAVLAISGMTCDGCANTVTRVLSRVPGVTGATVDFGSGRATVTGNVRPEDLVAAVQAAGYGAQLSPGETAGGE
ncbi:MAG TPA: heavy metal-associated domain-containing protein [Stellaceae bacterium]|nr:heavy metal-associated domain-containing protein [Stellaceae bacterium]